jgi:hypothetical protein
MTFKLNLTDDDDSLLRRALINARQSRRGMPWPSTELSTDTRFVWDFSREGRFTRVLVRGDGWKATLNVARRARRVFKCTCADGKKLFACRHIAVALDHIARKTLR